MNGKERLNVYKNAKATILSGIENSENSYGATSYDAQEIIIQTIENDLVNNDMIGDIMMRVFEAGKIAGEKELKKKINNL